MKRRGKGGEEGREWRENHRNVCGNRGKCLYLQRQSDVIGYPGRIPRGSKTSPTLLHYEKAVPVKERLFLFVIQAAESVDEILCRHCATGYRQDFVPLEN